jgi:uncharacterized membrane protein
MEKEIKKLWIITILIILTLNFSSALIVDVDSTTFYSGEQEKIKINIENNFNYDIECVSIILNLNDLPFAVIGSFEKTIDDLDAEDKDSVIFNLRPSTDISPGDYNIPYTLKYTNMDTDKKENKSGSFGLRVGARTNLDFLVETKNNVVGQQGKISLKIINKGFGEIKFVSVQIFPENYELISSDKVYIGNIDSDDSDFATFDVIFKNTSPSLSAIVEYKDFDNNAQTQTITLPIKVYTKEKALELGLIQKSKTVFYIGGIIGILIVWIIWKKIKRFRKNKNQKEN